MKNPKKILALLLTFAIAAALCACGEAPSVTGKYTCAGYEADGLYYPDPELSDAYISLANGGRGVIAMGNLRGDILWHNPDGNLSLTFGDEVMNTELSDGVLKLELSDGVKAVFLKQGAELPEGKSVELPKEYYGWWRIVSAQGEMPETWVDVCARLSLDDGIIRFTIWDEDGSFDKPMGSAVMKIADGVPVSRSGEFWYSEITEGQWQLKPESLEELGSEGIKLSGEALDREGETFSYEIFLRPWGESWDDGNKNAVPYYYETWYLPLLEGENPMPDSFQGAENPLQKNIENIKAGQNDKTEAVPAEAPPKAEPPAAPAAQTQQPAQNAEINPPAKDFNEAEMDGFTDSFEG